MICQENGYRNRRRGERELIYRTEATLVNKKRTDKQIARSVFAIIEREIKRFRNKKNNNGVSAK